MFPANFLNAAGFQALTGIPIQIIRAGLAVLITVNLIRVIQLLDQERAGQLHEAQQARLEALEQIQHELEKREAMRLELLRHTVIAQEEERARLARELHDETAQVLSAFSLNLATLRSLLSGRSESKEILERLANLTRQMSQGLYRLVNDLRPAQLDDLGLPAALKHLADLMRSRQGLEVSVEILGPRQRLDPLVETVIFRVAQEALTNVSRHAQTDRACLRLALSPEEARLSIMDQGVGFNLGEELVPPHGWGLAGMRERVESVGGSFEIATVVGAGTRIEAVVPLKQKEVGSGQVDTAGAGR
jgi:signal transduction histidine kinase